MLSTTKRVSFQDPHAMKPASKKTVIIMDDVNHFGKLTQVTRGETEVK